MPVLYPTSNIRGVAPWRRVQDAKSCLALLPEFEAQLRKRISDAIWDSDFTAEDVARLQALSERRLLVLHRKLAEMSRDGSHTHVPDIERAFAQLQEELEAL